jgi:hypothetical protein
LKYYRMHWCLILWWRCRLMNEVSISFDCTFSIMKWQSISMCLIRSWKTRFDVMCHAAWLSYNNFIGSLALTANTYLIQVSSLVVKVIAQYSASVLHRAVTFYFLLFHVTKVSPTKVQKSVVNFLLNLHFQSTSE